MKRTPVSLPPRRNGKSRGSALSMSLLSTLVVVGVGMAMTTVSISTQKDNEAQRLRVERKLVAESGLAVSYANLVAGGTGNIGSSTVPMTWGHGTCYVTSTDNHDGTYTLNSYGRSGTYWRTLRAVLRERVRNPFYSAIYAGNSTASSTYTLTLGGTGTGADSITGDVYSGGNIALTGNSTVNGSMQAAGTITGGTGQTGVTEPPPDLVGAHYETNHDIDVAAEFAAHGTYASNAGLGGSAYQLPQTNPAHIFRKNPSDRSSYTAATAKDDYFLEDPYMTQQYSDTTDPTRAAPLELSGTMGISGTSGNNKVYWVDGNLWIHNLLIYSFTIKNTAPTGTQITIVVKGNIYYSDNLLKWNAAKDGIAMIAVKDPNVADSGNIYFGDPTFGTLNQMDAYMYAENNFKDNNLGVAGSNPIAINGIMSAGNQVAVNQGSGTNRTKLIVNFDSRVKDGTLTLPGLPQTLFGSSHCSFEWLAEFEVAQ